MAEFDKLQKDAQRRGERGANLGHVLQRYGGAKAWLRLKRNDQKVEFVLAEVGDIGVQSVPLYKDHLSGMEYFFTILPLEYLHHDDRINPRTIGQSIRGE